MELVVIKDKLKAALDVVVRASGDHPTLPILKNVLISANSEGITLTTTNLDIGIKHNLPGKVVAEGSVNVPAAFLSQISSSLAEDRVQLKATDNSLMVTTDSYEATLQGSPIEEFPSLPVIENEKEFLEFESSVLGEALENVLAAAQFSELRPELSSVFFQYLGDRVALVSTDSFRLAEKTLGDDRFSSNIQGEFKVLLPLRTAQELARILKGKEKVRMYRDPSQALFKSENVELISRLLEGTFPDYQSIIPKEYAAEIILDRDELLGAIKLVGVMSGTAAEITLRSGAGGVLEVFSRDEKAGENVCRVAAKMKGTFNETSFNWRYLNDGLKTMPPKEILLGLNDDNKPAILRSQQNSSHFYLLMPILRG